jgi:SsrA-binding protein
MKKNAAKSTNLTNNELLTNKRGMYALEITDTFSGRIKLFGFEVKALKTRKGGTLAGSFISEFAGELFLKKAFIPPYQENNTAKSYEPRRTRKILLLKKDILKISFALERARNLTLVPTLVYTGADGSVLLNFALCKKMKKFDKRETLKAKQVERDIARTIKLR